jgi:predicted RNase H-like HicB family nuclease
MLHIEVDREDDGRFIAEVVELPGVLAYGPTSELAVAKAAGLALQVIADRVENGERVFPEGDPLPFKSIFEVKSLL